jgi:hypothetical protein
MMAKVFKEDKVISAYVDDIVVQSKLKQNHIEDLTGRLPTSATWGSN